MIRIAFLLLYPFLMVQASAATSFAATSQAIPIHLDFAFDIEKSSWGLMQRKSLPPNEGMLFPNLSGSTMSFWAFNCYIDLAIAFLDKNGLIQEITYLKAYPEKMDPLRPVYRLKDMDLYPQNDPIRHFFLSHAVRSTQPSSYALETNRSFFIDNQLNVGDVLHWNILDRSAFFTKK